MIFFFLIIILNIKREKTKIGIRKGEIKENNWGIKKKTTWRTSKVKKKTARRGIQKTLTAKWT